jgi:hypothetical protein
VDLRSTERLDDADVDIRNLRQSFAVHMKPKSPQDELHRSEDRPKIPIDLKRFAEIDASEARDLDLPSRHDALGRAAWIAKVCPTDSQDL